MTNAFKKVCNEIKNARIRQANLIKVQEDMIEDHTKKEVDTCLKRVEEVVAWIVSALE